MKPAPTIPERGETVVLYAPVAWLMFQLPKGRRWTRRERDRWLNARAMVDCLIDVIDEDEATR